MAKDKLSLYQAKRDFTKTKEPSGAKAIRPAEHLRFVIQKHAATRLHYDLRLEVGGVFKSWAVTKGPSLDPKDKRLAVETEDHPLDYGDFEGTIPKGEYGGGTVMLWDRGFWAPADGTDPEKALRKGELKFNLAGEKLQGGWVIVRMRKDRDGGKRNNWLLIKHRDGYEKEAGGSVLDEDQSVASGRSMEAIAGGEGRGPSPFMLSASKAAVPDAVWHSQPRPKSDAPQNNTRVSEIAKGHSAAPSLRAASCLHSFPRSFARPPAGRPWVKAGFTRSSSMAIACSCGSRTARHACAPGRDWTGPRSFKRLPTTRRRFPPASSTVRSSRSMKTALPTLHRCRRRFRKDARKISSTLPSTC